MTALSVEEAFEIAQRFRSALDQGSLTCEWLRTFPLGTCGLVSRMLGEYMRDQGLGVWYYCDGWHGSFDGTSHAWIIQEDVIADITADQFGVGQGPVLVTRNSDWHRSFFPDFSGPGGVAALDPQDDPLRADYETLKSRADRLRGTHSSGGPARPV